MDHAAYVDQIRIHAEALRAAAVEAGPGAPVPTCEGWDVHRLVDHMAKVHARVAEAVAAGDLTGPPQPPAPPESWDELLPWWDEQLATLLRRLTETSPDAPAWVFAKTIEPTVAFWSRRQAHEAAIHRLDAEHALAGSAVPTAVPTLVFDPEFAADGIDELLSLVTLRGDWSESTAKGTVLYHAADAGRAWTVRLSPGEPPHTGPVEGTGIDADALVAGTADALYRAVWGRPSTALRSGDTTLIEAIKAP